MAPAGGGTGASLTISDPPMSFGLQTLSHRQSLGAVKACRGLRLKLFVGLSGASLKESICGTSSPTFAAQP